MTNRAPLETSSLAVEPNEVCDYCGKPELKHAHSLSFWRVTCIGAPGGGIPVHRECCSDWFARLDASPFWRAPRLQTGGDA
jgi:hypothetical protein